MAIEKMTFVNLVGQISSLDEALFKIVKSGMFHLEDVSEKRRIKDFENLNEQNPYINALNEIEKLLEILKISPEFENYESINSIDFGDIEKFLKNSLTEVSDHMKEVLKLKSEINLMEKTLAQIGCMLKLNVKIDKLFNMEYVDARFGRIPTDSYLKLSYFENENFFFVPLSEAADFCWGLLLVQKKQSVKALKCFESLYFEEFPIPKNLHETPQLAHNKIKNKIEKAKAKIVDLELKIKTYKQKNTANLLKIYSKVKFLKETFEYKRFVTTSKNKFHLNGFVQASQAEEFTKLFEDMPLVIAETLKVEDEKDYVPPVKLKTCRLFKPFEGLVSIYGLPKYGGVNPSNFVGVVYSLIFGMMFGDFGQGFLVLTLGFLLHFFKKINLGLILTRCGFCSMVFGLIYDSCFGFEGIFLNFWKSVGAYPALPFNLLKPENSTKVLLISCIVGMMLTTASIVANIFTNLKTKRIGVALFSNNGLAGFVLYFGISLAIMLSVTLKINVINPIFLIFIVLIPTILIFFCNFLSNLISKLTNKSSDSEEKFSIMSALFDMIDIVLSYFTNTLSFLRIGGLALGHAALMLIVVGLTEGCSKPVALAIAIIGNGFVMVLEGLIVSIQTLRLVYYEMFSRFYETSGKPFTPAKVSFKKTE